MKKTNDWFHNGHLRNGDKVPLGWTVFLSDEASRGHGPSATEALRGLGQRFRQGDGCFLFGKQSFGGSRASGC